jgi:hypothetical protein
MRVGNGVLGLRNINTCRKVPFQVSFLDDDICIAFYESYLSRGLIRYIVYCIVQYLIYECQPACQVRGISPGSIELFTDDQTSFDLIRPLHFPSVPVSLTGDTRES